MGNPLKKTMVFLGLAEEQYDDVTGEVVEPAQKQDEKAASVVKAPVTPLRRVAPVAQNAAQMNEILTVHPTEFDDIQLIAENFRIGVPVIINLSRMTDTEARRMVDFAIGLSMGLEGVIEKVTNKVFLISPKHISVTGEENPGQTDADRGSFFVAQ